MARQPQLRYSLFDGHVANFSGKLRLVASALTKQRCSVLTVCSVRWAEASQRRETSVHGASQMAETWYSDFCGVLAAFCLTFYFDSNMKISPCGGFRRSVGHPN